MTEASRLALERLRSTEHFEWYVVNLVAVVFYIYASAIRRKAWGDVYLAIAFSSLELIWEMANALVLHFTDRAALWTVAGKSSYVIYVGLNLEIALMFAVMPLVLFALIDGLGKSYLVPALLGVFCVAVECILNQWGALAWFWPFWRWPFVALIVVVYAGPLMALAWARAHLSERDKRRLAVAAPVAAVALHCFFALYLHWI